MASSASTSHSDLALSNQFTPDAQPQADALPRKRGEIGYTDGACEGELSTERIQSTNLNTLPDRHPADDQPSPSADSPPNPIPPPTAPAASAETASTRKPTARCVLPFLRGRKNPKLGGIYLTALFRFFLQLAFIGGTIAAWVTVIRHLSNDKSISGANSNNPQPFAGNTSAIFVHVAFGVVTLGELLFLERSIFQLRAQRYCSLHPGEMLPSHRTVDSSGPSMAFAPWNRPPLPTYAATLAQSGYGTGDVEDNIIAIPPPPAYGNTRGSTLLLASFLRNSLRQETAPQMASRAPTPDGRPMSYVSHDEAWEERLNAERAMRLEQTLARLEEGSQSPGR